MGSLMDWRDSARPIDDRRAGAGKSLMHLAAGADPEQRLQSVAREVSACPAADQVASWVGTGQNCRSLRSTASGARQPRHADVAGKLGMSEDQAAGGLETCCRTLVDQLTPLGLVTPGTALQSGLAALAGKLLS